MSEKAILWPGLKLSLSPTIEIEDLKKNHKSE